MHCEPTDATNWGLHACEMQENTSRLLIVEATDNEWKADSVPDNYADMSGVQTALQVSQSAQGVLDE